MLLVSLGVQEGIDLTASTCMQSIRFLEKDGFIDDTTEMEPLCVASKRPQRRQPSCKSL